MSIPHQSPHRLVMVDCEATDLYGGSTIAVGYAVLARGAVRPATACGARLERIDPAGCNEFVREHVLPALLRPGSDLMHVGSSAELRSWFVANLLSLRLSPQDWLCFSYGHPVDARFLDETLIGEISETALGGAPVIVHEASTLRSLGRAMRPELEDAREYLPGVENEVRGWPDHDPMRDACVSVLALAASLVRLGHWPVPR